MNIWIGLLFLDGALPDVGLARELATEATTAAPAPAPAEPASRDRELQADRDAVALKAGPASGCIEARRRGERVESP